MVGLQPAFGEPMKLTVTRPPERTVTLQDVPPFTFVEVRAQNTTSGGTEVKVVRSDSNGAAIVSFTNKFTRDRSVSVRILIAGEDTTVHHLTFAPEQPTDGGLLLIDEKAHRALHQLVVQPQPPVGGITLTSFKAPAVSVVNTNQSPPNG